MKFTILCLLRLQLLHTKFDKNWPSSSSEEELKYDRGRQKPTRSNKSPEWLGWPFPKFFYGPKKYFRLYVCYVLVYILWQCHANLWRKVILVNIWCIYEGHSKNTWTFTITFYVPHMIQCMKIYIFWMTFV